MPSVLPATAGPRNNSRSHTRPRPGPIFDHTIVARAGSGSEVTITATPVPREGIMELFGRLAAALHELDANLVHLMVFGNVAAEPAGTEAMRRIFGALDWPVTWVDGSACDGQPIAGLQAFAVMGREVQRIRQNGGVIGSVYEDGTFRHCRLGGLGPNQLSAPRGEQTKQTLDNLGAALASGGFGFADVMRTWFYLDDILSWYGEFNQARTQVYSGIKFRTGSLPASTGIGARNCAAAALTVGAWAVQPLSPAGRVEEVASPLQCPAPCYGSSFSRATEISSPAGRALTVSGTASISPDGRTLWVGDVRQQLSQTMQVVEKILQARRFEWADVTRATAYFKHRADAPALAEWSAENSSLPPLAVASHCDICRDDLLFEIEVDAWKHNRRVGATAGQAA